ncbi:endoribonuclease Dicer homolog 2-like isoform X1 [Lycium barbarum]|uniref:endoribonuclease Dicer homolog 2-like isoform X1 n=2 Tax=Lycium barbarum TaxID=112863 RepID=UPI00293F0889|nr:endoribonuclease Dicer homolog 2-like isoform X1 [Lycium barbarum]
MEPADVEVSENQQLSADPLPFARSYQLEALETSLKQNTIVYLETGSGKTLIAIMLLRSYAYLLRKPSPYIAVFLVPKVVLVTQQGDSISMHTDLKVGTYWGEMGVDYWKAAMWQQEVEDHEVLVMTPAILLAALRHSFLKIEMIKVIIFDECHNARGKHDYACIMKEFYHGQLTCVSAQLPRIFGMTASPIKSKGSGTADSCWQKIRDLENLMHSKVYTCVSESVLAEYIPFSNTKLKIYQNVNNSCTLFLSLAHDLKRLKEKHECSISKSNLSYMSAGSATRRLTKLYKAFLFCLSEMGAWLAFKAAEFLSCAENEFFSWGELDVCAQTIVRDFSLGASKVFLSRLPSGSHWSIGGDIQANTDAGYLTSKVTCLIESLLEYRDLKDLRCIIFVERIITAIVLRSLLNELLPELTGWRTEYTGGHTSVVQSQSRKTQNKIVEKFRKGLVNIIVATSILEEGLDVQSCNLVVRFDPSTTVCSFIQSRGRARMQNSDFLLMIGSGDSSTLTRMQSYMASGEIMRQESLRHASIPCSPLDDELLVERCYKVESTGAVVTLSSSVSLLYFYCSRLPSDGYFKPNPRCVIDNETETCTLHLPKSCPLQRTISVQGNAKILKQLACLEACKELHHMGALTDNLVPDIVEEEAINKELEGQIHTVEESKYFPPELVSHCGNDSEAVYYCYLVELEHESCNDFPLHGIILAVRKRLMFDDEILAFELDVDRGRRLQVQLNYSKVVTLTSEEIRRCQSFQVSVFRILLDRDLSKVQGALAAAVQSPIGSAVSDYLLLPSLGSTPEINWKCVNSLLFPSHVLVDKHMDCCSTQGSKRSVNTKTGVVCSCMLENSLVCTPHNGHIYCITGFLDNLDCNSLLDMRSGESFTYKEYYKKRHGIKICFEGEPLLRGKHISKVHNYLQRCRAQKAKDSTDSSVELPPELCSLIMAPVSIFTLHTYSYVPSIMHRIESLVMASNLKRMHLDDCTLNVFIPTAKVLEAMTTKKCLEKFHLESLETLGDSFLKYAASIQLFKTYENHHEGLLTVKKNRIISNAALCRLAIARKIPGFIRNEPFDLKTWLIPGDNSQVHKFDEEFLMPSVKMYSRGKLKIKSKRVADVVEALIGAYLSSGGEVAALSFMKWLGLDIDFVDAPMPRHFPMNAEKLVNVRYLESMLHYKFNDPSLLVEALTHGSYMLPEIPRCYQRLEFLGDAVLDYVVTAHLYFKYPGLTPGLITDLRSASVNNECYAYSAVKAGLHKYILHASQELQRQIFGTVKDCEKLDLVSTFGWEAETAFPKVLGDVIESLAGAIFVDSSFNKDVTFQSIRPLLEPLITPQTIKLHPVRELSELCDQKCYIKKKNVVSRENGVAYITVEVEANGVVYKSTCSGRDKIITKKVASKNVLKSLKECASNA